MYSNERRFRFGLAPSPQCTSCGQIETVDHQLLECNNAKRIWTGSRVNSINSLLSGNSPIEVELFKCVLIKSLIQIDRSSTSPNRIIAQDCAFYLRIEAITNPAAADRYMNLVSKLNAVA